MLKLSQTMDGAHNRFLKAGILKNNEGALNHTLGITPHTGRKALAKKKPVAYRAHSGGRGFLYKPAYQVVYLRAPLQSRKYFHKSKIKSKQHVHLKNAQNMVFRRGRNDLRVAISVGKNNLQQRRGYWQASSLDLLCTGADIPKAAAVAQTIRTGPKPRGVFHRCARRHLASSPPSTLTSETAGQQQYISSRG